MSQWDQYKKTMQAELHLFDLARSGDLVGLSKNISTENINLKNEKGHSVLMLAAYNGHAQLVKFLLSYGADPNSVDLSSNSILMGVAFKGHIEILKDLIDAGADIHFKNHKNQNAIDYASMFGRVDAVKLLKHYSKQPEVFNVFDFIKSWSSVFNSKEKINE
jgi:ankyrin repeat protein